MKNNYHPMTLRKIKKERLKDIEKELKTINEELKDVNNTAMLSEEKNHRVGILKVKQGELENEKLNIKRSL